MLKCIAEDTCVPELKLYVNLWFMHMHCTLICAPQLGPAQSFTCSPIYVRSIPAQSISAAEQQFLQSAVDDLLVHMPVSLWTQCTARCCMLQNSQSTQYMLLAAAFCITAKQNPAAERTSTCAA